MSLFKKKDEAVSNNTIDESEIESVETKTRTSEYKKYSPPSSMKQIWEIMLLEFKQYFKSKGLIILFVLAALIPLVQISGAIDVVYYFSSFLSQSSNGEMNSTRYLHYCLILLPMIMLIAMVFLCGRTISQEYVGRTCFLNFPLPIDRWVLYTGKFIAISITCITLILFSYGLGMIATNIYYGNIVLDAVYQSVILSIIVMLALIATGMLFSILTKRHGGLISFALIFIAIPVIPMSAVGLANGKADSWLDLFLYTPPFTLDSVLVSLSWDPTLSISGLVIGQAIGHIPTFAPMIVATIAWAAVFYAIGLYLFNRREV